MRFLFTVHPLSGHFHAMVPLAQALQAHGHEVAFATGKSFGSVVQRVGFQHFPCGLDFNASTNILEALPDWEMIRRLPLPPPLQQLYGFIDGLGPYMVDDLLDVVAGWKPSLIVRDPTEFGGYIAAERHGLPHASIMWALYIDPRYGCADALHRLRQRYGLPDNPNLDSFDRYLVLKFLPPSWPSVGAPEPPVTHEFSAPPFDRSDPAELPDWVYRLPDRPTIYATLGTTFNQAPSVFRAIIAALSTEAVNVIMTVGRTMDPAQFGPLPDHIRVERYIPQSLLLPHCNAFVFHGGYNSLLSALWHRLPMVVIPMEAGDQMPTAQQCVQLGIGRMVEGCPAEPEAIRSAILTVLKEPAYLARVEHFRQEIMGLPDLSVAVKRLEILAETGEPQLT